jgi:hypothetical protein
MSARDIQELRPHMERMRANLALVGALMDGDETISAEMRGAQAQSSADLDEMMKEFDR